MLYAKINHRVDNMISNGLKREVEALLKMGVSRDCTSMQAIGYKEISDALIGIYEMNDAVEKVKMESRRYAKRQLTWLRRDNEIRWITWDKEPDISRAVDEIIETERSLRQRHEKK
jgi:tRNA dimethylallyltransferase